MCRLALSLCVLLALPAAVPAARVSASRLASRRAFVSNETSGGPHKCTIVWKYRDQVASASFGVKTCKTECLLTNADYNVQATFPRAFKIEQRKKNCVCWGPEDTVLLKFPGQCGDEKAARERCWNDYKILATDTWEAKNGKTTPEIKHHPETYFENHDNFNYGELKCEDQQNECGEDLVSGDCFEAVLPSIFAGRDASLLAEIAKIAKALADGEIKKSDVDRDLRDIIDAMPEKEKNFYALVSPGKEANKDAITVAHLRDAYEDKLEGTGISVDSMLKVAGFDTTSEQGLAQELNGDDFERFLNPDCEHD